MRLAALQASWLAAWEPVSTLISPRDTGITDVLLRVPLHELGILTQVLTPVQRELYPLIFSPTSSQKL